MSHVHASLQFFHVKTCVYGRFLMSGKKSLKKHKEVSFQRLRSKCAFVRPLLMRKLSGNREKILSARFFQICREKRKDGQFSAYIKLLIVGSGALRHTLLAYRTRGGRNEYRRTGYRRQGYMFELFLTNRAAYTTITACSCLKYTALSTPVGNSEGRWNAHYPKF